MKLLQTQSQFRQVGMVLGGERREGQFPLPVPKIYDDLILVDAGILLAKNLFRSPPRHKAFWIGDGDSAGPAGPSVKSELESLWQHPIETTSFSPHKDFSDFGGALDLLAHRCQTQSLEVHIFSGLGGRRDHEQINLLEASEFVARRKAPTVFIFHPALVVLNTEVHMPLLPGTGFSLVPRHFPCDVAISGADYSGTLKLFRPSHGLSNRAQGGVTLTPLESATLTFYLSD